MTTKILSLTVSKDNYRERERKEREPVPLQLCAKLPLSLYNTHEKFSDSAKSSSRKGGREGERVYRYIYIGSKVPTLLREAGR